MDGSRIVTDWLRQMQQQRVIAVIRSPSLSLGWAMAQAALEGGIGCVEVAWTSAQAQELLQRLRSAFPDRYIGAGTILDRQQLQGAIAAGAQFCFSPVMDPRLIQASHRQGVPFIPGALTPTEIERAWTAGAAGVKVFPVNSLGGSAYVHSLQGPLGHIPLIPTGGVSRDNLEALLQAGAIAVGLSHSLFPLAQVQRHDWNAIRDYGASVVAIAQRFNQGQSPDPVANPVADPVADPSKTSPYSDTNTETLA